MNGFWYTAAIALTFSAVLTLQGGLKLNSLTFLSQQSQPPQAQALKTQPLQAQTVELPVETGSDSQRLPSDQGDEEPSSASESTVPAAKTVDKNAAAQAYQRAIELANQAVKAYAEARDADTDEQKLTFTRRERFLWQASLQKLATIPEKSALYERAVNKQTQYKQLLATAESKLAEADSAFLTDIIYSLDIDPQSVHITLCQIDDGAPQQPLTNGQLSSQQCRYHQGDQQMASAASMIKVPIAMVLMHKVSTENIDLSQEIYIDPGNFTEDADGAKIEVGREYPLREVMGRMIDQSNNIATNQLVDYLGRDYIEQTLKQMGYVNTYAGHKLAGDQITPVNAGTLGNYSTSHDITAMMIKIYRQETPADEQLVKALVGQTDRELGYEALKNMGPAVVWLGEKTGQNNRVLATTLAMKIGEERYALTVALNYSGDVYALQQIVHGVAAHILETGPIIARSQR